jgi:hypothetical protein
MGSRTGAAMIFLAVQACLTQPPAEAPTDAQVREQIGRLDSKDKAVRLEAVKWLVSHASAKNAGLAVPVLERSIHEDRNAEVRMEAVNALGQIAKQLDKPCPLVLLEALLDQDSNVRQMADARASFFTTFAPGSVEPVLRAVWSDDADIRNPSLLLLAQVAPRDDRALAVIETAKQDRAFQVRHAAYCAKFKANDRLDEFLIWMIRMREDPDTVLAPAPEDRELRQQDQTMRNLFLLYSAQKTLEWIDKRPDELSAALLKLLDHKSPVIRRGSAWLIGAEARQGDAPDAGKPAPSKVTVRLEKLKIRERLVKLSENDLDASVRAAARDALTRLSKLQEK